MVRQLPAPDGLIVDPRPDADVVVVCVTYNSAEVIVALLAALPAALEGVSGSRVLIVDNDSTDGTTELVRTAAPWARLIEAGRNGGYAAGINLALRRSMGRRGVYILNPDAIPSPGSVAQLLSATDRDPSVGIAAPRILTATGQLQFSLRREPTVLRAFGEAVLGGHRAGRIARLGEMITDPAGYLDGATADWSTGAALFVARRALDAVGDWDERFFLYSEETDYALRVRDAGFRLCLVREAVVVHRGGDLRVSPYLWGLAAVNRTRLYRKRHARLPTAVYWSAVLANEAIRSLLGSRTHRAALRALLAVGPEQPGPATTPSILRSTQAATASLLQYLPEAGRTKVI
jgi:GT2 family glycosyltransferase